MLIWYHYESLQVCLKAQENVFHSLPELRAAFSTHKHESKQGIISGMHFKDLTESYAQKQTQHRSGHCWQNILHFVLKFTSGTASLRGIWKKKWSSLGISQQITTIFYCSCLHNRSAYKSKSSGLLPSMTMHLTFWRLSEKKNHEEWSERGHDHEQADMGNIF